MPGPQFVARQLSSWKAVTLFTHWKKHPPGPPPLEMQSKKQLKLSTQVKSLMHAWNSLQHV